MRTSPRGTKGTNKPPDTSSVSSARRWMTADWGTRRALRLKRLGEWVAMTRAKLGLTLVALQNQARRDGEDLSETLILRLEKMRLTDYPAAERRQVSLTAVDYLAALSGQTLADVDAYLRTGEAQALEPSLNSDAETVRAAFLSLSPNRRQSLMDFAQHLYHLDLVEAGSVDVRRLTDDLGAATSDYVDAETQRARDELRAVSEEAIRVLSQSDQGVGQAESQPESRPGRRRHQAR